MWPLSSSFPEYNAMQVGAMKVAFDYIIVGGGTAGCCLASRLSEDPAIKVLLIERGPVSDDWISKVPLLSANFHRGGAPSAVWKALPIKNAHDRVVQAVTGNGLGGGSRINGAIYTRGVGDYNKWRDMGHPGWGYDDIEQYFVKSEKSISHSASSFRGGSGPWTNQSFPTFAYKVLQYVKDAAKSIGIPIVSDVNSPAASATCYATLDMTIDENMHRASTFDAFLPKSVATSRASNLVICSNTTVTRIHFSSEPGQRLRADGVCFEEADAPDDAKTFYIRATKEVVLCAGAIASPHILMLSGIGPAAHLKSMNVKVIKDMPGVGSYLRDHAAVPISFEIPMNDSMHLLRNRPLRAAWEFIRYLTTGNSLFIIPFLQSTIFVRSALLNSNMEIVADNPTLLDPRIPANLPDIEIMPIAHRCNDRIKDEIDPLGVFTFLSCLLQPKSWGTVRLVTTDPQQRAAVELGFLNDPEDTATLRTAIRLALRLAEQMRALGYAMKDLRVPASGSDEDIDEYIRGQILTSYHYAATCRMAPEDDAHPGVVNDSLKVHGVDGLRICDTSVFPDVTTTHTMAGAVVVAEKCADMMKKEQ